MEVKDVTKSIMEIIMAQIIANQLKGGQRLNENQWASEYQISRGPLREAFRLLEKEGLVVSIPRKGTFVKHMEKGDIIEIYQIREMIECYAVDLMKKKKVKNIRLDVTPSIPREKLPVKAYANPQKMLPILNDFLRFHMSLVSASENSMLINYYQTITSVSARCEFKYPYSIKAYDIAKKEHKQIARLLQSGAFQKARELLRKHIQFSLELVLANIKKNEY